MSDKYEYHRKRHRGRQISLQYLMITTTILCVLFGVLRGLDVSPTAFVVLTIFWFLTHLLRSAFRECPGIAAAISGVLVLVPWWVFASGAYQVLFRGARGNVGGGKEIPAYFQLLLISCGAAYAGKIVGRIQAIIQASLDRKPKNELPVDD